MENVNDIKVQIWPLTQMFYNGTPPHPPKIATVILINYKQKYLPY